MPLQLLLDAALSIPESIAVPLVSALKPQRRSPSSCCRFTVEEESPFGALYVFGKKLKPEIVIALTHIDLVYDMIPSSHNRSCQLASRFLLQNGLSLFSSSSGSYLFPLVLSSG
eukprot:XP_020406082.1 uncharacterized protein LOC109944885 [Zea mays]